MQPPNASGAIGQPLFVNVAVSAAADLGAFQFTLTYDPSLLEFETITPAQFLSSTGRSPSCNTVPGTGNITVSCVTLGTEPPTGPSGAGVLADIQFTPLTGGTGTLALSGVILTTPAAVATTPSTQDGTVTIDGSTPTPCAGTCPTVTPIATSTLIPTPSGAPLIALNPASPVVSLGDIFSINVDVTNGPNVAAFQFTLQITSGRLELQSAVPGLFLGSTGRSVFCPPVQASTVFVTFGCVTQGATTPGATGNGTLATLTFKAVGGGAGTFTFTSATMGDPLSVNIPLSPTGTDFSVLSGATATPTPCGGPCPTSTPTPTFSPTPTAVSFPASCPTTGSVCVQPDITTAQQGDFVTVGVVANGVSNLGAYQFQLTFDPTIVSFVSLANGPFLGGTGRTVLCAAPIVGAGTVRTACSTLGPQPPSGPTGNGVLAVVTFQALTTGVSPLQLTNTILTDPAAVPITVDLSDGSIVVDNATPTPCAGPCPTATPTLTPSPTATPAPISCPAIASTVVCVVPGAQVVQSGDQVTFDLVAAGVSNLAAYQVEIQYDPTLLTYVSATNDVFLGSTGRTIFCPPVILNLTSVVYSCASIGFSPPGPDGTGILLQITFQTTANVGTSPLKLLQYDLTDPLANPIPASAVDGSVGVQ